MELLVATRNQKKLKEIKELLGDLNLKITSLKDYKNLPRIIEDGENFTQNAIIKACTIAQATGKLVLGEDSGLEVAALNNKPGVYSARYAGKDATDRKNNLRLLRELKGVPLKKRVACYQCCVALADRNGLLGIARGNCRGLIGFKPQGSFGFGYDPLFIIKKYGKTFGQLGPEIKHQMSHRHKALKKARLLMERYLKGYRPASS